MNIGLYVPERDTPLTMTTTMMMLLLFIMMMMMLLLLFIMMIMIMIGLSSRPCNAVSTGSSLHPGSYCEGNGNCKFI